MSSQLDKLKRENRRLIGLLERYGIDWNESTENAIRVEAEPDSQQFSTSQKIELYRNLFRGRTSVYALRWENAAGDRSGYSPACGNEWRSGICQKPRIKCSECQHRELMSLSAEVIYSHLSGKITVGIYPLMEDNTCYFLAVDFDKSEWREDVLAFAQSCDTFKVPVSIEISRSGAGAHAWIFFDEAVHAQDARQLGTVLISHTCNVKHQLDLSSYDRLFPNQDSLPGGGFGNLIALPLQKLSRDNECCVFVDRQLQVIDDQWSYLSKVQRMNSRMIESAVSNASGSGDALDVSFIGDEDLKEPWKRSIPTDLSTLPDLPESLELKISDKIYIQKQSLPQSLLNRLVRLAAFQNPEFYKAQAMRFPVWGKPRVIGCADNYPFHIALPRGCIEAVQDLTESLFITVSVKDERSPGISVPARFLGKLSEAQRKAVNVMLVHDTGILSAPTAFGKTVVAAAIVAERKTNTLVLVHRSELMDQWLERLQAFLDIPPESIGRFGGGQKKITGKIDVALVQSLSRKGVVSDIVEQYGQVIVDECHHLGAQSFEAILKRVRARYVLGLTATPVRRDGLQPIIFMQCGPIRHRAKRDNESTLLMQLTPVFRHDPIDVVENEKIQEVFKQLTDNTNRNREIAEIICRLYEKGKKILVLTERTDHIDGIQSELPAAIDQYVLHGKVPKKVRADTLGKLKALEPDCARVLLATGKLIGEGFDHAALDVLIMAHPISWKGTLQQYVGRLHRSYQGKGSVLVVDIVDLGHPMLVRMWERRQKGYRAMGYQKIDGKSSSADLFE